MIVKYNPREITAVVRFLRKMTQQKLEAGQTTVADIFRPHISEQVAVDAIVREIKAFVPHMHGQWEQFDTGGYSVLLTKTDDGLTIFARVFIELYIAGLDINSTSFDEVPFEINIQL